MSFHEVMIAALGPRSERERKGPDVPPNRLLVSVACHLLNEVLSRQAGLTTLWPLLREVIFKALFVPTNFKETPYAGGRTPSAYPSFTSVEDFFGLRLWSDEYLLSRKEGLHLSDKVTDLKSALENRGHIIKIAERRIHQANKRSAFRIWRASAQRSRLFRQSLLAYVNRARRKMLIEGCFLRWRRFVVQTTLDEVRTSLKESNVRLTVLEGSTDEKVQSIEARLREEKKATEVMKLKVDSLSMQLVEKQMLDLRTLDSTLRNYRVMWGNAEKESRRWERLAKTFTCRSECPLLPPAMRKHITHLRSIEAACVAHSLSLSEGLPDARSSLEGLLLAWVNSIMKDQPKNTWRVARRFGDGANADDFGLSSLSKVVKVLCAIQNARSTEHVMYVPATGSPTSTAATVLKGLEMIREAEGSPPAVFREVVRLIHRQTVDGLFPPLLSHCTYLESFYTPQSFCQKPHPTALLWILSTLFIGYARLMTECPSFVAYDIDPTMRCPSEASIGSLSLGPSPEECGNVFGSRPFDSVAQYSCTSQVVTTNTVVKKTARSGRGKGTGHRKVVEEGQESGKTAEDKNVIVDTASDVEVYLGGYGSSEVDEASCSNDESAVQSTTPMERSCTAENELVREMDCQKQASGSGKKQKRATLKHHLPTVSKNLMSVAQREFVKYHDEEAKRKRAWIGVSRIVTSLIVRFRILDLPQGNLNASSSGASVPGSFHMPRIVGARSASRAGSKMGMSTRIMPGSFRGSTTSLQASIRSRYGPESPSTLRRWLEKGKKET
uniref:Uncharacterized protein TCIL3000_11_10740 n=1 Tax=Trypanosoma congolense (strain IL3000) TaxID=1068625 RepID=G0V1S6_TRYCI|nr:unnamed protein product [Trypanosoma congolense IL3000]